MKILLVEVLLVVLVLGISGAPLSDDDLGKQGNKDEEPSLEAFQGDMLLTKEQRKDIEEAIDAEKMGRKKRKAASAASLWPLNIVPYVISPSSFPDTDVIREAIDHWESNTCLRFVPQNETDPDLLGHNTTIVFVNNGGGCGSYIGRVFEGEQPVFISKGCGFKGIVAHELGHVIGFHHEQSRPDRDDYITVHFENIVNYPVYGREFEKYRVDQIMDFGIEYDLSSLMHYGRSAFSSNSYDTITPNDPLEFFTVGNRENLTFADIKLANFLYQCNIDCDDDCDCLNDGYQGPDCSCVCPPGFSGNFCQINDGLDEPECAFTFTDACGTITSPNYPSNYDNLEKCVYYIEGPVGSTVELTFNDFLVEYHPSCSYDYLQIRDRVGDYSGDKLCGGGIPDNYVSYNGQMMLVLVTDSTITARGFNASYRIIPVEGTCGGDFSGSEGLLASPNYPSKYDRNLNCEYVITVDPFWYQVELTFLDFSVQNQFRCNRDYVEVDLGSGTKVPIRFCGNNVPTGSLISTGNRMVLTLKTNLLLNKRGFVAKYRAVYVPEF